MFAQTARTTPEAAALQILDAILQERPRLLIGADAYVIDWMQRLLPDSYDQMLATALRLRPRAPRAQRRTAAKSRTAVRGTKMNAPFRR